jgi:hypothetical protein
MVEVTKSHVTGFFYMLLVVLVVGCIVFYLLSNVAAGAVPLWLTGGIVSMAFYLIGYLVRWITAKKKTA